MQVCPEAELQAGLWFMNSHVRVALSKADNDGGFSLLEHALPYGDAPPLHMHLDEDELFYLLAGEVLFKVGDASFVARAGDAFVGPRGVPHGFYVLSREGARLLTITSGGFEDMIRSASRPAEHPGWPSPVVPTAEMQADLAEICRASGIELQGPPITA